MTCDVESVTMREATVQDFERIAELRSLTLTEPVTLQMLLDREKAWPADGVRQRLVAVAEERVIAQGQVVHYPGMQVGAFYQSIDVDHQWQGRGIGSSLLAANLAFASTRGGRVLVAPTRDDRPAGLGFLEKHGYVHHQHLVDRVSDLQELHLCAPATHFQVLDWTEVGDTHENRRKLHWLHNESDRDTPGSEIWGQTCYELFEEEFFGRRSDPHALFVAVVNGEWAGMTSIERTSPNTFGTHYTGVLHSHRGKGIGRELKRRAVLYALAQGARFLRTQNDVRNEAMLAINRRFGFKPELGWLYMKKEIQ